MLRCDVTLVVVVFQKNKGVEVDSLHGSHGSRDRINEVNARSMDGRVE